MSVLTFSLGKVSRKSIEVSFIPQEIIQRLQRVCNNRVLVGKVFVCHIYMIYMACQVQLYQLLLC